MKIAFSIPLALALVFGAAAEAAQAPLPEPTVFQSRNGVLDLLMIARETRISGFNFPGFSPTGWAYQVCLRPASGDLCPVGTPAPYGGVRLALEPGDLLKIRFVNRLPPVDPSTLDHAPDDPLFALNPTNLHTHGLIVDASPNTAIPPATPVYGDFVFTSLFNPANGDPSAIDLSAYQMLHAHGDVVKGGAIDYAIHIPLSHPSGLFFFHPHMHGIALPQISAGLSGAITIGDVGGHICLDAQCADRFPAAQVRHLLLKEMQVLPASDGGTPHLETDGAFCQPTRAPSEPARRGLCPSDPSAYPAGGYWFYTVNGARFPTDAQASPDGEVWRIVNAAGSVTYNLALTDDATQRLMPLQILALDGVAIHVPTGTPPGDIVTMAGARFRYAACPLGTPTSWQIEPVCATELFMMPSSRAEVWASYTDAQNHLVSAPAGQTATLRTVHVNTGPVGDDWPGVELAKIAFASGARRITHPLFTQSGAWSQPIAVGPSDIQGHAPVPAACAPLAAGHRRRIFFANMDDESDGATQFGLAYEEVDQHGRPVPGSFHDVEPFNPAHELCLPLGPQNSAQVETWELINLSGELHNFHIHQTKFQVLSAKAPPGTVLSGDSPSGTGVLADNVPLPYAQPVGDYAFPDSGACLVADYRSGKCKVTPVLVQIPFTRIGRFVFHCHILEHEDGGMMHAIRVVRSAS